MQKATPDIELKLLSYFAIAYFASREAFSNDVSRAFAKLTNYGYHTYSEQGIQISG
ncbi:MAG: hypothetical protein Q8909_14165 [Bacteroidota bacterium]|nr:hypothetical protein [Bacteroidota bacterium]